MTIIKIIDFNNHIFQTQQVPLSGMGCAYGTVGDVNGDGLQDVIIANALSSNVSVLINNGNFNFTEQLITIPNTNYAHDVSLFDADNDGISIYS